MTDATRPDETPDSLPPREPPPDLLPTEPEPEMDPARAPELGGRDGPEPTRYGDWENNGVASDF